MEKTLIVVSWSAESEIQRYYLSDANLDGDLK